MKKKIALLYGGSSSEAEISVQSGKYVSANIDRERYDVYEVRLEGRSWRVQCPERDASGRETVQEIEMDKTDFTFVRNGVKTGFDLALIMIHGTPGEDGLLQGYLEMMGIPHSTCSAFVTTISFDKHSCKRFLESADVKMAPDVFLREGLPYSAKAITAALGLPLFVKPTNGGSSFGVTKVKREEDLDEAIRKAFAEHSGILVEAGIDGRELTQGVYCDGGEVIVLPVTEIVTGREFFDYRAKYEGESEEICPAPIPDALTEKIGRCSRKIYNFLGCRGLVRLDYIVSGEDIYFLEINTVPGMTPMSLVPGQVRASGQDMRSFLTTLIENIR